jgi:hypothetical protein
MDIPHVVDDGEHHEKSVSHDDKEVKRQKDGAWSEVR